jgi:hypothetical protein
MGILILILLELGIALVVNENTHLTYMKIHIVEVLRIAIGNRWIDG